MRKLLAAIALSGVALPAFAIGTLIPAANRTDMVHDEARGLVYIANGTQVLRYDVATGNLLAPISLGGSLGGIDISPDNRSLVVADMSGSATQSWVHLVELDTLAHQIVAVDTPDTYEGGTFTAVYGADNRIYTTSTFNGSGWVAMRRLDPSTGAWVDLRSVRQNTMLSASGDARTIAFAESNSSGGNWGLIDIPTGAIALHPSGIGASLFEIATDRFGAQFSVPTYSGTKVHDDVFNQIASIGVYAMAEPIGLAYHPVERIAYFPFAETSEVRVYDMDLLAQTGALNFENAFDWGGNRAFVAGRTRLSRDGSLLMVTVGGGVRIHQQYAPLQAGSVSVTTNTGQARAIALDGSVGNGGALEYSIASPPAHGTTAIFGSTVSYAPAPGFAGTDSFNYRVSYGRAVREGVVSITVVDPNRAPVAIDDAARTRTTTILIPVLANDSDPDGDALSIASVTAPNAGTVSIQGSQLRFVPPKKWPAAVTFYYTISDGRGKQATARVTITRS